MNKFSKFLKTREGLLLVIRSRDKSHKPFFIFILLLTTFFLLFPMWQAGRLGVILWVILAIFLIFIFTTYLLEQHNYYLLTNQRIIYLQALNKKTYTMQGAVQLRNISQIKKKGRHDICLLINQKTYYLVNIEKRDIVYKKIKNYII
ncbi:MAG: hypothetical protein COV55_04360 [Candidatus Komeilibacteria bacterium CG11_big_fil_rev_8_21_14_0_20_36_20]|uniref:YokE-like PH domain-containing protein n=1 Tax=Candidatus Komeilibacteria bacterium CG11_big_fil_rev_8_21_14_0_20_36_20 TaxID=1974477 RepID=A0A2H0NBU1_9BACT|nr:MAG: hypothetical protein COV55_04360 [Candidatus Komeilibacteria bacterium CG11_big_fil_rev_8_21_14_0_20_36_20]PIR81476.1 MAG: hypothetical protein COU21_03590 [Candidatus Komeilibacteria bacterium CG10_big_fil_rev_8_21_14_0_10_36_65]PJC55677.1 MAG: hypothetical protein CO027_00945 [Candidatus Komeilibacteria bacterium CG_4_9_14_0_2_um_filter_36_13]